MHICVVTEGYPYAEHAYFTFVQQLCIALADNGVKVSVITPKSVVNSFIRRLPLSPKYRKDTTPEGNIINVYSPRVISIGLLTKVWPFKGFNSYFYKRAICKTFEKNLKEDVDVLYSHFWHSGYAIYPMAKKYELPLFVASGEHVIGLHKTLTEIQKTDFIKYVTGVICVSTKNLQESIEAGLTVPEKCKVIPNAIDSKLFYKKDKLKLRETFGFSNNDFIVAFVGSFIHRKGANRIAEAITSLNDSAIKSIFIGRLLSKDDDYEPKCEGILYKGPLEHGDIVNYLNGADVFVLPTLHEGCSNAIVEALACGLPIISSDKTFNYDILDESCSILIDPLNVQDIANAIKELKSNPERRMKMSKAALQKASEYQIEKRAQTIIDFIKNKISK